MNAAVELQQRLDAAAVPERARVVLLALAEGGTFVEAAAAAGYRAKQGAHEAVRRLEKRLRLTHSIAAVLGQCWFEFVPVGEAEGVHWQADVPGERGGRVYCSSSPELSTEDRAALRRAKAPFTAEERMSKALSRRATALLRGK